MVNSSCLVRKNLSFFEPYDSKWGNEKKSQVSLPDAFFYQDIFIFL